MKAQLSSRERVNRSLNHEETDRIPLDLGSTPFTTLHLEVAKDLNRYFGLTQEKYEFVSFSAQAVKISPALKEKLNIDTCGVTTRLPDSYKMVIDETNSYVDEWGIQYRRVPHSFQYDFVKNPLEEADLEELENFEFPDPVDDTRFAGFREQVKQLYDETDKAIVLNPPYGCQIMAVEAWLTGFERHYCDIATDHEFLHALSKRLLDWYEKWLDRALDEVGEYISVVACADDLGIQSGPMIRPETYRELFQPYHKQLYNYIKERTDAKIFLHSCGSVVQFMDDMIENGVEILNPVQVTAKDMDTQYLKKNWGDRLTFWGGGCNAQKILPFGTVEEVKEEVHRRVRDLKPQGGFVFAPIHNVLPGISGEKVAAMYQTAWECGQYKPSY
ncbi:hypothetical protein B5F53_00440 [Blautia sp. An249]|uniref:uroporphyrinogen decarboxylase family protein n=1 Tax=Blautia sp. An249 TaxID=1965603 RepID=UPI000B366E09|nr:uroporphyrinogen decarboxylase family protein [Blautia sp. An249]OUO81082.1 hypothetical protein B5F53_00440 [Blautia sp. An249]